MAEQNELDREVERQRKARERAAEVATFWRWAPEWMEKMGKSEEELLKRWPSYRGTKPEAPYTRGG